MAAAPRKTKFTDVPNLYVKRDKRTGNLSCQYKDVRTKKFHGLGSDLEKAEKQARQLNAIISRHIIEQEAAAIINGNNSNGITVGAWIEEYLADLQQAMEEGEIKPTPISRRSM